MNTHPALRRPMGWRSAFCLRPRYLDWPAHLQPELRLRDDFVGEFAASIREGKLPGRAPPGVAVPVNGPEPHHAVADAVSPGAGVAGQRAADRAGNPGHEFQAPQAAAPQLTQQPPDGQPGPDAHSARTGQANPVERRLADVHHGEGQASVVHQQVAPAAQHPHGQRSRPVALQGRAELRVGGRSGIEAGPPADGETGQVPEFDCLTGCELVQPRAPRVMSPESRVMNPDP